jgi:hypothetical protein
MVPASCRGPHVEQANCLIAVEIQGLGQPFSFGWNDVRFSAPRYSWGTGPPLVPDGCRRHACGAITKEQGVAMRPAYRLYDLNLGRVAVGIDLRHPPHLCQREFEDRVARFDKAFA